MAAAVIDIHKLLDIDPKNGKPVIRGSRLRVETLIGLHLNGMPATEIASSYPKLSLPAVYAALAYYYEHQEQMDAEHERELGEALADAKSMGSENP